VLTHLHSDHIGWAVPNDSPFTGARVIVQRADVEAYRANREAAGQYDALIEPLRHEGRLLEIDMDPAQARLTRAATLEAVRGHGAAISHLGAPFHRF
jgi:glyoxylase-like metal-dependent hydrolase (beta-lactamase superfamily II)